MCQQHHPPPFHQFAPLNLMELKEHHMELSSISKCFRTMQYVLCNVRLWIEQCTSVLSILRTLCGWNTVWTMPFLLKAVNPDSASFFFSHTHREVSGGGTKPPLLLLSVLVHEKLLDWDQNQWDLLGNLIYFTVQKKKRVAHSNPIWRRQRWMLLRI